MLTNELAISAYLHCGRCLAEFSAGLADGRSPADYSRLSVGFTRLGIQVWCTRHNANVLHMDFQGKQHPADSTCGPDSLPAKTNPLTKLPTGAAHKCPECGSEVHDEDLGRGRYAHHCLNPKCDWEAHTT